MRENVNDRNRLEHILEAIDCILEFPIKTEKDLMSDKLRYYGIVKSIEIIGEAVYKLTQAFRSQHQETPWDGIAQMRHVLVHDYYKIDADEVLKVINNDLPPLRQQVARYLAETNWDEWEKQGQVIAESAVHKSLVQTATRMKRHGYDINEICKITGLSRDEIEIL